jgi:hypothetical protein
VRREILNNKSRHKAGTNPNRIEAINSNNQLPKHLPRGLCPHSPYSPTGKVCEDTDLGKRH